MFDRACLICGKKFQSKAHNAKHCSRDCKLEAKRRRYAVSHGPRKTYFKVCTVCGESFESKWAIQKYCSDECYRSTTIMRKRVERKKRQKKSRKGLSSTVFRGLCSVCGADNVPVIECHNCGYLTCRNCSNDLGICKICSEVPIFAPIIAY